MEQYATNLLAEVGFHAREKGRLAGSGACPSSNRLGSRIGSVFGGSGFTVQTRAIFCRASLFLDKNLSERDLIVRPANHFPNLAGLCIQHECVLVLLCTNNLNGTHRNPEGRFWCGGRN
jgi:hypothetical protein